jgi:hypothetical protein
MAISDIPVDQSNSLLPPCLLGESDSSETDPAVVFLASCPMDLAVGQNVDAGSELVVVLGEDQPLVGGAVAGKLGQETPAAALDQATDNANTTSEVDVTVRSSVRATVPCQPLRRDKPGWVTTFRTKLMLERLSQPWSLLPAHQ